MIRNLETSSSRVAIIGAGLAGCEAAYFLAEKGYSVHLFESKKVQKNPAQKMETACELVCTNSLKSVKNETGHGMLKREMRFLNSLVLEIAEKTKVPAGDALAVDREKFSAEIDKILRYHPKITFYDEVVDDPVLAKEKAQADVVVMATGPLTEGKLGEWISHSLSQDDFYFYDAIAPVVDADSLNYEKLYWKDRHGTCGEEASYLNAPMNKQEYERFIQELINAEKMPSKDFEKLQFFEGCLPIDVMAERGIDTARFSCLKPVGLEEDGQERPYAVVQLRKENFLGGAFNLVGMQTRLTYKEQVRVFRMIPGLEEATFLHLGSMHRNSFVHAGKLLNNDLSTKKYPWLYLAGQMTGVEGYTESASMGLYVAFQIHQKLSGKEIKSFPAETAMGALVNYLMTCVGKPAPSNIHFGLMPPLEESLRKVPRHERKKLKKRKVSDRAIQAFTDFFDREIIADK